MIAPTNDFLKEFLDQSLSQSSSSKSIETTDGVMTEESLSDSYFQHSNATSSPSSSFSVGAQKLIDSHLTPPHANQRRNASDGLSYTEALPLDLVNNVQHVDSQDVQHKLEEARNELLNKQNIISVLMKEISKILHPSFAPHGNETQAHGNETQWHQLSEVQEILRVLSESFQRLKSEKAALEAMMQEMKVNSEVQLSVQDMMSKNNSVIAALADQEAIINQLRMDLANNIDLAKSKDFANDVTERNLSQATSSLQTLEAKCGFVEKENLQMTDKISEQNSLIATLQEKLKDGPTSEGSSCQISSEKDSHKPEVEDLQKVIAALEKNLSDEKLCRESARKSFLKEIADCNSKMEEDKSRIMNLQEDVDHLKSEHSETASSLIEKDTKISLLSSDLSQVEQQLRDVLNKNDELRLLLETSQHQVKDLTSGLDSHSGRSSQLEVEFKKLASQNEELEIKLDFNVAEKSCMEEELRRLNLEVAELQKWKTCGGVNEDDAKELPLGKSLDELQRLKDHAQDLTNEIECYKASLDELKVDHQKKVLQLECHAGDLMEQLKMSGKEKNSLNEKKFSAENELKQLYVRLKELDSIMADKDKGMRALEKQVLELKSKLERKSAGEGSEASVKVRSAEMNPEQSKASELERTNLVLKQQVRKLEVDLEDVRSSSSTKLNDLTKKLDLEQRRSSRFCDSLRRLSSDDAAEDVSTHLESLVEELEETKGVLQEKEEMMMELEKKLKDVESENRQKEFEIGSLKHSLENIKNREGRETSSAQDYMDLEEFGSHTFLVDKVDRLEQQLRNIQDDHQHELAVQRAAHRREMLESKEEAMRKLADAEANSLPINEDIIRKKYSKDVNKIKEMYNKGFNTLEKSQQQSIAELKRSHVSELERLRLEKEQLLQEEVAATQAALDAMRKAHEAELEKVREKFLDRLSHTYSTSDMKALQKKHEEDVKFIEIEIKQLSEQYSIKCLENAVLNERLKQQTNLLYENRKRVQDLLARNEELTSHMKYEIEKLRRMLSNSSSDKTNPRSSHRDLSEVVAQAKQAEIFQLSEQLKNVQLRLDRALEEGKEFKEKYNDLYDKVQHMRSSSTVTSLDTSTNDADVFKGYDDDADSILNSTCSDWLPNEPFSTGAEVPNRGSSRKLTWKFKGRDSFNARLTLEKCKSVDSDHSVSSTGIPDSETALCAFVEPVDAHVEGRNQENVLHAASDRDPSTVDAPRREPYLLVGDVAGAPGDKDGNNNRRLDGSEASPRPKILPFLGPLDMISQATGV